MTRRASENTTRWLVVAVETKPKSKRACHWGSFVIQGTLAANLCSGNGKGDRTEPIYAHYTVRHCPQRRRLIGPGQTQLVATLPEQTNFVCWLLLLLLTASRAKFGRINHQSHVFRRPWSGGPFCLARCFWVEASIETCCSPVPTKTNCLLNCPPYQHQHQQQKTWKVDQISLFSKYFCSCTRWHECCAKSIILCLSIFTFYLI